MGAGKMAKSGVNNTEKPGADPKTDRDRTMQFQDRVIAENGTCQDDRHLYRE